MNKKELIANVAKETGLTQKAATAAVDAVFGSISGALAAGDKVALPGFGTFEVRHRGARMARNPRTKTMVEVPETNVPAFKPGKALKEKV